MTWRQPFKKRATTAAAVFFLVLLFLLAPVFAQEEPGEPPRVSGAKGAVPFVDNFLKGDDPIEISAGSLEFDNEKQIYRASGTVTLSQNDILLQADSLLIDAKARTVSADGNVVLGNAEGELHTDSLHLNLGAETGVIVRGRMVVRQGETNYYFTGDRIEKVGPSKYIITNGTYSTCDCDPDQEPDWYIEAERINLELDGYAVIYRGRYTAFGNPLVYVPYGVFPAKVTRQTGFLWPEIGWANDDGYRVKQPFYWAIDQSNDMIVDTEYMENRGLKEGLSYRYAWSQRWKGQFDMDVVGYDHTYGENRWAVAFEQQQNIARRLYLRAKINAVSDNDYVVDFPSDISARYDTFLRSNVILNNLWEHFDLNIDMEHYDDLQTEDNAATWQHLPEAHFNGIYLPFLGPVAYRFDVTATHFERDKATEVESELDALAGHDEPFTYLSQGQRYEFTPELTAPFNFNRYAYLTPVAGGYGTVYYLDERQEEQSPFRPLYFVGSDLHTELERVFPVWRPALRGLKHSMQPGVSYLYFPDSAPQDDLPIFDGRDRHSTENVLTYYFDNRLWLKMFNTGRREFFTWKLLDLRLSQDYDFHEAARDLIPIMPDDERRPFSPIRARLEAQGAASRLFNRMTLRTDAYYNPYDDRIGTFNILGAVGTSRGDMLGVEYRYHIIDNSDDVDIDFLSAAAAVSMFDYITLGATAKYSFIDEYFIERIYSMRFTSLQNCWWAELQLEQREIPEDEIITRLLINLTGLVGASTAF